MITRVNVSATYECSLESAFKTPMLCDLTKIHTGMWMLPKVTHTSDDKDWGKPGSSKKVYMAKSLFQKAGFASVDNVLERKENEHWKIQVDDFQSWMLGFYKFVGTWKTTPLQDNKIRIDYVYFLHSKNPILYPFNWVFGKIIWKRYMKQVVENIREMIQNNEVYLYD